LVQKSSEKFLNEPPPDIYRYKDLEDEMGGFIDTPGSPNLNYIDALDNGKAFKTTLLNNRDVSYLGPIFIGQPKSQGAMVVYDTGSDWLTIKSCLTDQHCN
jgi:hypothetical protein